MRGKVTPPLPAIIVKPQCNYVYFYAWGLVSVRIFEEMGIGRQLTVCPVTVALHQATFYKLGSVLRGDSPIFEQSFTCNNIIVQQMKRNSSKPIVIIPTVKQQQWTNACKAAQHCGLEYPLNLPLQYLNWHKKCEEG
jgi:hypothetical protein